MMLGAASISTISTRQQSLAADVFFGRSWSASTSNFDSSSEDGESINSMDVDSWEWELASAIGSGLSKMSEAERTEECLTRRAEIQEGIEQIETVLDETERDVAECEQECRHALAHGSAAEGANVLRALAAYESRLGWAISMADGLRSGIDVVSELDESRKEYQVLTWSLNRCYSRMGLVSDRIAAVDSGAREAIARDKKSSAVLVVETFFDHCGARSCAGVSQCAGRKEKPSEAPPPQVTLAEENWFLTSLIRTIEGFSPTMQCGKPTRIPVVF